jgi:hypothetical protein
MQWGFHSSARQRRAAFPNPSISMNVKESPPITIASRNEEESLCFAVFAPTIAALLGLNMTEVDGHVLRQILK